MGENIRLTAADGFELGAYRARPDGAVKGGVVVVQEIFGVNVHIRSVCDRYAEAGYLAVAPAIYDRIEPDVQIGYEPDDIARGRDIRAKADMANVIADVAAAADAAAEGGKVGTSLLSQKRKYEGPNEHRSPRSDMQDSARASAIAQSQPLACRSR